MTAFYCFLLSAGLALCQQPNQRHNPPFKIAISADSPTPTITLTRTTAHS
jgi:hypothetical protein